MHFTTEAVIRISQFVYQISWLTSIINSCLFNLLFSTTVIHACKGSPPWRSGVRSSHHTLTWYHWAEIEHDDKLVTLAPDALKIWRSMQKVSHVRSRVVLISRDPLSE